MSLTEGEVLEPSDFTAEEEPSVEVIDTTELVTEPQSDTGAGPSGRDQARLVRVARPGGVEQGENNWTKRQLVRRPWERR